MKKNKLIFFAAVIILGLFGSLLLLRVANDSLNQPRTVSNYVLFSEAEINVATFLPRPARDTIEAANKVYDPVPTESFKKLFNFNNGGEFNQSVTRCERNADCRLLTYYFSSSSCGPSVFELNSQTAGLITSNIAEYFSLDEFDRLNGFDCGMSFSNTIGVKCVKSTCRRVMEDLDGKVYLYERPE